MGLGIEGAAQHLKRASKKNLLGEKQRGDGFLVPGGKKRGKSGRVRNGRVGKKRRMLGRGGPGILGVLLSQEVVEEKNRLRKIGVTETSLGGSGWKEDRAWDPI